MDSQALSVHVWIVLDLDDQFNVKVFRNEDCARSWLTSHGYSEVRVNSYRDQYNRGMYLKEVILHG